MSFRPRTPGEWSEDRFVFDVLISKLETADTLKGICDFYLFIPLSGSRKFRTFRGVEKGPVIRAIVFQPLRNWH